MKGWREEGKWEEGTSVRGRQGMEGGAVFLHVNVNI